MNDEHNDIELTGEDNVDEIEIEELEKANSNQVQKLKKNLRECEKEKLEHLENLQRTKAEFLNAKKRLEEQLARDNERILSNFVESLLPLCDSFDMAFSNEDAWKNIDDSWRKGIEGIRAQLDSILKKHSVVEIRALGEHFDPERHEAVSAVDSGDESDTVIEVLQKGYERNGEVIRPAKVIIQN